MKGVIAVGLPKYKDNPETTRSKKGPPAFLTFVNLVDIRLVDRNCFRDTMHFGCRRIDLADIRRTSCGLNSCFVVHGGAPGGAQPIRGLPLVDGVDEVAGIGGI